MNTMSGEHESPSADNVDGNQDLTKLNDKDQEELLREFIASNPADEKTSLSTRAKRMLMGDEDVGQYLYRHTGVMLPRKHQHHMGSILQLFGRGLVIVDVASGEKRAALGFLAPKTAQNRWVPGPDYIIQTAVEIQQFDQDAVQCEVVSLEKVTEESWSLGEKRKHALDEFPRKHLPRICRIAGTPEAFKLIWRTMTLVFIWEREPRDDLGALIRWVGRL